MPIDLPSRNVYLSFNFEFNYATPRPYPGNLLHPWLNQTSIDGTTTKRSLFSRKSIYQMFVERINYYTGGHMGEICLQRLICEAAQSKFIDGNGIFGDLIHILLTPSSSRKENDMNNKFYNAEDFGRSNDNGCVKYKTNCDISFIDFFSEWNPNETK